MADISWITNGTVVSGPGITGTATVSNVNANANQFTLSTNIANATNDLTYTRQINSNISTVTETIFTVESTLGIVVGNFQVNTPDYSFLAQVINVIDDTKLELDVNYFGGGRLANGNYQLTVFTSAGYGGTIVGSVENVTTTTVTVTGGTAGMVPGMTVSGSGIIGTATITSIVDASSFILSQNPPSANGVLLTYSRIISSTSLTPYEPTIVTVPSTRNLEVGMIVSGPGIFGSARIVRILNATQFEISENLQNGTSTFTYTVQADHTQPIDTTALVGSRLSPPVNHELGGFVASGQNFYPDGYLNPFSVGFPAANQGAIIPVNALPADKILSVRWFKKDPAPSAEFASFYVPGKVGRYTVGYPNSTSPQIVIASGVGSDDLPEDEANGTVYFKNEGGWDSTPTRSMRSSLVVGPTPCGMI